jgi:POT family proton-dependent oligopeptide transporter
VKRFIILTDALPGASVRAAMSTTSQAPEPTLLGHPRGLFLLFFAEMWERFSYYGMRGLLILYLTKSVAVGGLGFSDMDGSSIYGWYTGLVYLTPLAGGWVADNVLGQRKSITLGGVMMAIGQFCLFKSSAESLTLFYLGLGLLIIGNGFFKPNISTTVGMLYEQGDKRRDPAFTIFYMGINAGAFLAPLVCGQLAENVFAVRTGETVTHYGFQYGFLAAGLGMVLGQVAFTALGQSLLGNVGKSPAPKPSVEKGPREPLTREERDRVTVIFILAAFVTFFWAGFEQAGSSLTLYTDRYINRQVGSFTIPTSWFQSVNAAFIVLLAPLFAGLWTWLNKRGMEPNTPRKMAIGLFLLGYGFLLLVGAVFARGGDLKDPTIKASLLWLVGTYLIHTTGELCLSPVGLSMVTKLAPIHLGSMLMGVWFLANFVANKIAGNLGGYVEEWGALTLFGGTAGFVMFLSVVLMAINKPLVKMMHGRA